MQGPTSAHDKILAPPLTTKIFWEDIIKAAGLANPVFPTVPGAL